MKRIYILGYLLTVSIFHTISPQADDILIELANHPNSQDLLERDDYQIAAFIKQAYDNAIILVRYQLGNRNDSRLKELIRKRDSSTRLVPTLRSLIEQSGKEKERMRSIDRLPEQNESLPDYH